MFRDFSSILIVSLIILEVAINLVIKIKIKTDLHFFNNVLLEHGELAHVLPLAVNLFLEGVII